MSPTGMAAKKLVLLSMVAVRAAVGQGHGRGAAEIVGQRHHGAAVHHAETVIQLLADVKLRLRPDRVTHG